MDSIYVDQLNLWAPYTTVLLILFNLSLVELLVSLALLDHVHVLLALSDVRVVLLEAVHEVSVE